MWEMYGQHRNKYDDHCYCHLCKVLHRFQSLKFHHHEQRSVRHHPTVLPQELSKMRVRKQEENISSWEDRN